MNKKNTETSSPKTAGADSVQISKKQADEVHQAEGKAVGVKCKISDLSEQIIIAERQRNALFDELYKAQTEYWAKLNKVASMNGIDTEAKPEEVGFRWNFDRETNTFNRVDVPTKPTE